MFASSLYLLVVAVVVVVVFFSFDKRNSKTVRGIRLKLCTMLEYLNPACNVILCNSLVGFTRLNLVREDDGRRNNGRDYIMHEPKASVLGSRGRYCPSEHTKKSRKAYQRVF